MAESRAQSGSCADEPAGRPLAVVTRAATGIGRELAKQFAEHDFDLILAGEEPTLAQAVGELERQGAGVLGVQVDLGTLEGVDALCAVIDADGRPVEAIAVTAGSTLDPIGELEASLDDVLHRLRHDVVSTVHLSRCVLDRMVAEGRGRVLYAATAGPASPSPYRAVAEASASFVQSFADGLRQELVDTGVTVTALLPGPAEGGLLEPTGVLDTDTCEQVAAFVAEQGFGAMMAGNEEVLARAWPPRVDETFVRPPIDPITEAVLERQAEPGFAN